MQRSEPGNNSLQRFARKTCLRSGIVMAFWIAGCGSGTNSSAPPATPQQAPQTYFAPIVSGIATTPTPAPQTFIFDEVAMPMTFSQETFALSFGTNQIGPEVINAGSFTASQRGLLSLGILTNNGINNSPAKTGSFAVELAGQAGGLVQLVGQPAEPLVPAMQCPNFTSAQSYQFITIPGRADQTLTPTLPGGTPGTPTLEQNGGGAWNPTTDTAYGSVDIISSGNTVTFQKIHQYILPSQIAVGGTGAPSQPSSPSVPAPCGSTTLGEIIGVPAQYIVTDPGASDTAAPPQAAIGIGPTGLLVEDNGSSASGLMAGTSPGIHYENVLGAGTGAVGLPKPSNALDTGAVIGAQYLGFIYAAGASSPAVSWSSHLASFGFSSGSVPSSCPSFPSSTSGGSSTRIYGGDYPQSNGQDDPSASPDGFGKCDFAIDLGTQSDTGLYPNATVWIGSGYAGYVAGGNYESFKAVAIAGQLNGKYALFLIGVDSTQPWAIYLLQSK